MEELCPRCGLPIGRAEGHDPVWTPGVKGVEVCGCPSEEEQLLDRAKHLREEVAELRHELDDIERDH